MSISSINNGEKGLSVRQKINLAIEEANKVANKINKVPTATAGNYAVFKDDGQIEESTPPPDGIEHAFCGTTVCPEITDNGDGSVTVGTGKYVLNQFDNDEGENLVEYEIEGDTFNLTDNDTNYIVANYNSGTPVLQNITDVGLIDESKITPVFTIVRTGTVLHTIDWDCLGILLANKLHTSIVKTQRFRRESGLAISEYGTRNVQVSTGIFWVGANRVSLAEINSDVDDITFFYNVSGAWTTSQIQQYNNTQYDDGTELQTLSQNKYAVNFIYRGVENQKHIYMFLGQGDYDLGEAESAQPPSDIPETVSSHAVLVGKIIVQKNAASAAEILSAFDIAFNFQPVTSHNNLTNLQGGTAGEYYHLTESEHTQSTILKKLDATAAPTVNDDSLDGYSVGSEWVDVTNGNAYICLDSTAGAAVWEQINGGGSGGHIISENGVDFTARTNLNFVTANSENIVSDDATEDETDIAPKLRALNDYDATGEQAGSVIVRNAADDGYESEQTAFNDDFSRSVEVDLSSNQQLSTIIPDGYRIDTVIVKETSSNAAGNVSLGTSSAGIDIVNAFTVGADEDSIMTLAGDYFSSVNDTDVYVSSSAWGSGVIDLYFTFKKVI